MSIPTIQNVSRGKINMRVFCSSNVLCQKIFSSELSFVQHRKQLLSELIPLKGFITVTDFRFMFLSIYITHLTRISPSREKNEAKRKSIILALISLLSLNRLCPKRAPEHIFIVQSSPETHYFYSFL